MLNDPILIDDWHPVVEAAQLERAPVLAARLLGEDLVIWRDGAGYHAWQDLCMHRGARLSGGRVAGGCLVCPYHGWTYNAEGRCVRIPAHPDQAPPAKARAKTYQVRERYGLLWASLGAPAHDVPPFPEWGQPGFAGAENVARGGYTLVDADGELQVVLMATGSEVEVALAARDQLQAEGIGTRVVSMPCLEWFDAQDAEYRRSVLPAGVAKVSVEAGIAMGWRDYVGDAGEIVSVDHFGESAAGTRLFTKYGFTAENIAAHAKTSLARLNKELA